MNGEYTLSLDKTQEFVLQIDGDQDLVLQGATPVMDNYNMLRNKPTFNGVVLQGNMTFEYLFPDGLIIDGGDAEEMM